MTPHAQLPAPSSPPTVLTCRSAVDLIAALPRLTGFAADDSLFLVLFDGSRVRCAMRVDLPRSDEPADWEPLIDLVSRVAQRARPAAAGGTRAAPAIVITTGRTFAGSGGPPWQDLAVALVRRLRREGVPPREACCLAADGWASYDDPTAPPSGWPRALIDSSPVSHRSAGLNDPPRLADLGTVVEADQRIASAVRREFEALAGPGERAASATIDAPPSRVESPMDWIAETADLALARASVAPGCEAFPARAARIGARANRLDGWFVLALSCTVGAERALALAREIGPTALLELPFNSPRPRIPAGSHRPPAAALLALELRAAGPPARMTDARRELMTVAGALPRQLRPGPLALAALLWWLGGLQSVSGRLLDAARAIRADDPAVAITAAVTEFPVIPEVLAQRRRSA